MDLNKLVDVAKEVEKKVDVQKIAKDVIADGKVDKDDIARVAQNVTDKVSAQDAMNIAKKVMDK